ncbi:MAG: GNAT family N-acetyltransferase [Firmicutes bacterium]|nr:GNAT family N-acetyltransferase [Bacillota bacterium]
MTDFNVQFAENHHLKQAADIYVRSWKNTYQGLINDSYLAGLCADKKVAEWTEYIEKPDQGMYIAISGGKVLGFAAFRPFERMENTVYVDSLHVDSATKGKGVGTALLEAVIGHCKEKGCAHMALQVVQGNNGAYNFYVARGGEHRSSKISTFSGENTVSELFVWDI